jgi:hypothetical protein
LDNATPHLANLKIQINNLIQLSHPAYSPDLARPTSDFWISESYAGREFIRNDRGAAKKRDGHFDVNLDIDLQNSI